MFNFFKSEDQVRRDFVNHQNSFYKQQGFKAIASYSNDVFTATWDLDYMAKQFGEDPVVLEYDLLNSGSQFPENEQERVLANILIEKHFKVYIHCYKTSDGRIIRAHRTVLT